MVDEYCYYILDMHPVYQLELQRRAVNTRILWGVEMFIAECCGIGFDGMLT